MIHPAPTDKISPTLARGILAEVRPATAMRPAIAILTFPNTSYQLHLIPEAVPEQLASRSGKRIVGTIHARARRVDRVDTGGRYVEPVFGRPRRVQGTVIEARPETRSLVVDAGMPIHCVLTDPRQSPSLFAPGDLVSFDVLDGATFEPQA